MAATRAAMASFDRDRAARPPPRKRKPVCVFFFGGGVRCVALLIGGKGRRDVVVQTARQKGVGREMEWNGRRRTDGHVQRHMLAVGHLGYRSGGGGGGA